MTIFAKKTLDMMIEALNIEKSFGNLKVLKGIDFRAENPR